MFIINNPHIELAIQQQLFIYQYHKRNIESNNQFVITFYSNVIYFTGFSNYVC